MNNKDIQEFKKAIEDVVSICNDSDYPKACEEAERNFAENNYEASALIRDFIKKPSYFDADSYIHNKLRSYFENYRIYWENEIGTLKRKSSIKKRREYISEQIDDVIREAEHSAPESVNALQEYKAFNMDKIGELL